MSAEAYQSMGNSDAIRRYGYLTDSFSQLKRDRQTRDGASIGYMLVAGHGDIRSAVSFFLSARAQVRARQRGKGAGERVSLSM